MSAQSNLVLNTKTYVPRGRSNGDISTWALIGDATFGGATSLVTQSVRGPSKDGITRIHFKVDVPKAAEADSPCGCAGQNIGRAFADITVVVPAGFSATERTDLTLRIQSLVANAVFTASVASLEGTW